MDTNRKGARARRLGAALACLCLFCLSGCRRASDTEKSVTLLEWSAPHECAANNEYLKAFHDGHPNIRVKRIQVPAGSEYWTKLETMMAGGNPPDLVFMTSERFPDFARRDAFLPLDEMLRKNPGFAREDIYPFLWREFSYRGQLYGMARDWSTEVLCYNRKLFDDARLTYPSEHWGWEDLLRAAKTLTKDTNGDGRPEQFGYNDHGAAWDLFVYQNGGAIFNEDMTTCLLDRPEAIRGIEFCFDLSVRHRVAPIGRDLQDLPWYQLEQSGKVAMWPIGGWVMMTMKGHPQVDWDIAPLPRGRVRASRLFASGYCIPRKARHPQKAWELLSFLAGRKGQEMVVATGMSLPIRKSIVLNHFLKSTDRPGHRRVFLDAAAYAWPIEKIPNRSRFDALCSSNLDLVALGKKSAGESCRELVPEVNTLLREK